MLPSMNSIWCVWPLINLSVVAFGMVNENEVNLSMPWLLVSPRYQQRWNSPCRGNCSSPSVRNNNSTISMQTSVREYRCIFMSPEENELVSKRFTSKSVNEFLSAYFSFFKKCHSLPPNCSIRSSELVWFPASTFCVLKKVSSSHSKDCGSLR